jgi:P27 family predicted phage terminase small subunit
MAGRKPKPTHLKLITGNPGKRKLNLNEPIPIGELKAPPDWFTDEQKDIWNYAIQHAPPGLLKMIDASVLMVWTVARDTHQKASTAFAKSKMLYTSKNGDPMQNPLLPVINKQAVLMMKAAGELGFTPSSRSRIEIDGYGNTQPENPLEKYL